MARNFEYGRHVLGYYRNRPGQDIHYKDAHENLGTIVADVAPDNIATFLARTVERHPDWGFTRTAAGTYRYIPPEARPAEKVTVPDMVEIVGFMEDKTTMIVRDESGSLSLWRRVNIPS